MDIRKKHFRFECDAEKSEEQVKVYDKAIDEFLDNSKSNIEGLPKITTSFIPELSSVFIIKPENNKLGKMIYFTPKKEGNITCVEPENNSMDFETQNYKYKIFYNPNKK